MRVVDAKKKKQRVQKKRQIYGSSPRLRFLSASPSSSSPTLLLLHSNQRFVFPFFATQATLVVIKIRSTHTIKNCWKTSPLCAPSSSSFCFAFSLCHLPRSFQLAQEYSKNTTHTHTCSLSLSLYLCTLSNLLRNGRTICLPDLIIISATCSFPSAPSTQVEQEQQ